MMKTRPKRLSAMLAPLWINQLVGYLLSGDPAYVTSHNDARSKIRSLERDELLEELVRAYLEKKQ